VVMGRVTESLQARDYYRRKAELWETVCGALGRLRTEYDIVVIEGAGSPAEVNLRESDVVNMRLALHAKAPVLLVGDIDRGGVFASLIGTMMLLQPEERALVRGLLVNKFRGDVTLLGDGLRFLEERTGVPVLGVIPYLHNLLISQEDSADLDATAGRAGPLDVAVVRLPRIANFDDFDLLAAEPAVGLRYVSDPLRLGRPDLIVLPGSKATVADLRFLRESGLARAITALARTGTAVLGVCGGYQMLGERILDPLRVESGEVEAAGLGLLPATTTFEREKRTVRVGARVVAASGPFARAAGEEISAYEIHMGTTIHGGQAAFELLGDGGGVLDGCVSDGGAVMGSYLHGLFENGSLRRALVRWLAERRGIDLPEGDSRIGRDAEYDRLAAALRGSLDQRALYGLLE
jgi:adenosylcobyric acid synthase